MEFRLKPNKTAFLFRALFFNFIFAIVVFGFFAIIASFASLFLSMIIVIFLVFIISFFYYLQTIKYRKMEFIFYDNRIVQKTGSIFSDVEVELIIKNITHVSYKLPFIEKLLFKTGHIDIQSAGSGLSEIHLCSIDMPDEMYNKVIEIMNNNGFDLSQGECVQSEKPNTLGVFFEVFKNFFVSVLAVFYVLGSFFEDDFDSLESIVINNLNIIIPVIIFIIILLVVYQGFNFLDLIKRRYKIYKNIITYKEGFLSRNFSFIPFENLTDSATTQTLVDKIFGLNDVKISCQGSKHEILFKNLKNGIAMSDTLDKLIAENKNSKNTLQRSEASGVNKTTKEGFVGRVQKKAELNMDSTFTAIYKINEFREFFGLLVLFVLLLIVGFTVALLTNISVLILVVLGDVLLVAFISIFTFIRIHATSFEIKERGVKYQYNFLTSNNIEFSADKVTGVVIRRNFIDKWFNTLSIDFWSIGASAAITFRNIKKTDSLITNILSKFGIEKEEELYYVRSKYNLVDNLKASIFSIVFFSLLFFIFITIIFFVSKIVAVFIAFNFFAFLVFVYLYKIEYYKRTRVVFSKSFVYGSIGWLFKRYYYSSYDDIKDIETVRYPFSREGDILFNIAGETLQTQKSSKFSIGGGVGIVSNKFKLKYIDHIRIKDELIDHIFKYRPNAIELRSYLSSEEEIENKKEIRLMAKPMLANTLAGLAIPLFMVDLFLLLMLYGMSGIGLLLPGLLVFIAFNVYFITIVVIEVKMKTYYIESYRVLSKTGIFYKRQKSIIFDKIDFINNSQFFLNKLFKNGNITVNTVGSSSSELVLKNMKNYREFYELLKQVYEKN